MGAQEIFVRARLIIEALEVRARYDFNEIFVSFVVRRKERYVKAL